MNKEEARKELEFYKNLAINHEALVKGCNEKIIELEAIINKPDRWQSSLVQPDKEQSFYLISCEYDGLSISWSSKSSKRKPEHAFRTREQAELIKEKVLLMQEMHAFAHVRNEGWLPDWQDEGQAKYGIFQKVDGIEVGWATYVNSFVFGVAVKSKAIAEEMLEIFGERIEKFYNKMY